MYVGNPTLCSLHHPCHSVDKWLGPHSFHVMVTLPGREMERRREGDNDLAWTQVKRKNRSEPQNEMVVELELKRVDGLKVKINHCQEQN